MKVYILTEEPYHDNSTILGVFLEQADGYNAAVAAASEKPDDCIDYDWALTEWDTEKNAWASEWDFKRHRVAGITEFGNYHPGFGEIFGRAGYERLPLESAEQGLWLSHEKVS